jgi:hypothetical protein
MREDELRAAFDRQAESGGFEPPVQFFQAGLLHAWSSKRDRE